MSENNRPNVFPNQGDIKKNQTASESVYYEPIIVDESLDFEEQERIRTAEQKRMRDEAIRRNKEVASDAEVLRNKMIEEDNYTRVDTNVPPVNNEPPKPPINNTNMENNGDDENKRRAIEELSKPQMNQAYDVIPLPSEGKVYGLNKKTVKIAYMTAADENILTSPNLINSGDFLEILINRKLLEPKLRYEDLIPGDRNAIMIWLRATAYGEMYPVTIYDNEGNPFDTEIDLSTLKTIKLEIEPDEEGLFTFELPLTKDIVKFRLLTVGDISLLEKVLEEKKDEIINTEATLALTSQIYSINDKTSRAYIEEYVNDMRLLDAKALRDYINKTNCGIDLTIDVKLPNGENINTFLPLTSRFFWPDYNI